jgi:hypothetical protein
MTDIRTAISEKKIEKRFKGEELQFLLDMFKEGWGQAQFLKEVTGKLGSYGKRAFGKTLSLMGMPMDIAERYNRMSLGLAAFRLAQSGKIKNKKTLAELKLVLGQKADFETAKKFAEQVVKDAHFAYGKGNYPEFLRGGKAQKILSTGYTFRSFSYNLVSLWKDMLFDNGSAGGAAFAYSLMGIMVMGGLASLPLYKMMSSLIRQLFGDDYLGVKYRNLFPDHLKDVAMYGAPSLLGVNIGGSLGMELPILDKIQTDQSIRGQLGEGVGQLLGIPYAVLETIADTLDAAKSGRYGKVGEIMLPIAARNVLAARRLYTEGQTSSSGKPINFPGEQGPRKLTQTEAIAKGIGFQPTSSTKAYDIYRTVEDLKNFKDAQQNKFASQYMDAKNKGDSAGTMKVLAELSDWNKRMRDRGHPEYQINLADSIKARMKTQQAPKAFRPTAMAVRKAYGE